MVLRFFLFAGIFLLISCTDFKRDNPYDPEGINFVGDQSSSSKPSSSSAGSVPSGGKGNDILEYETKKIDNQVWMAENLNYAVAGSKCGNGSSLSDTDTETCDTYGRLYNWATAMNLPDSCNSSSCVSQIRAKHQGICPKGWHIPSDAEWTTLTNFVGPKEGTQLKAKDGWNLESSIPGSNNHGFAALPGGHGGSDDSFDDVGFTGAWWTATEYDASYAYSRYIYHNNEDVYRYDYYDKGNHLLSVRCVQD
ncbi:MAG: hypothetical protein FWF63_02565 [Fibromonadales bacterium]|nr:hypothetical protein [Fibromonadales bacterium]